MKLSKKLENKFSDNISNNARLANYSWFNLGGPADYLFKPKNKNQLIEFLKENKNEGKLNITIIGAGSNTLIRDNGIRGVVIKLGSNFSEVKLINENIIQAGAGSLDRKVADFAKESNLSGLEFLSCIPGSIGGAVIMNSGCYGNDISKVLVSINVIDINNCVEKEIKREDIEFFYRGTNLPSQYIITAVKFKGKPAPKKIIEKTQNTMIEKKKLSQPSQVYKRQTFKNINKDKKAWMLIKESGCDEFKEGDAIISQKHCNFFVNNGKAKSLDIENLINKVKKRVQEKTGVNLELEIKIIGE